MIIKFSEVLPHLAKMTEYEPDEFYNWYIYAEVLMILGEYEKTIETLNSAKKMHENKSENLLPTEQCLISI